MRQSAFLLTLILMLAGLAGCAPYSRKIYRDSLYEANMENAELLRRDGKYSEAIQIYKLLNLLEGNKGGVEDLLKMLNEDVRDSSTLRSTLRFNFDMNNPLGSRLNRFSNHTRKPPIIIALCYPLNVLFDSLDIVSLHVGFGGLGVDAHVTHALQVAMMGGGAGAISILEDKRSPLSFSGDKSNIIALGPLEALASHRSSVGIFGLNDYQYSFGGLSLPSSLHNQLYRDYWEIGARVSAVADVGVDIHPTEMLDLLLGLFCVDLMDDSVFDRNSFTLTPEQRNMILDLLNTYTLDELNKRLQAKRR